jgi:hypothetical protein
MLRIVRRFWVTFSPTIPLPRVAPCTKAPFSYTSATARPSIFGSQTIAKSTLCQRGGAPVPVPELVLAKRVGQAEERHLMLDDSESFDDLAAHALSRRIRSNQLRMGVFQSPQLAHQRVVFGVADFGLV